MPVKDLLEWLDANPFAPFRIRLTNGQSYEVARSQDVWPGFSSALIGVPAKDNPRVYDSHVTVGLAHILTIEAVNPVRVE